MQFPIDIREVSFDRAHAEIEFLRDILVAQSLREQMQDLAFAVSEGFNIWLARRGAGFHR